MAEWLSLFLYVLQQLGVVLGVGAETVLLAGFLLSLHKLSAHEPMVRAARTARGAGLFLMIGSGAGAVVLHAAAGEYAVLLAPSFLFKWLLIGVVFMLHRFRFSSARGISVGTEGAHWYALFIVHTLAPVVLWSVLLFVYAAWLVFFAAVWTAFVLVMRYTSGEPIRIRAKKAPVVIIQKPKPNEPSKPKIVLLPAHSLLPAVFELSLSKPDPQPEPLPPQPAPKLDLQPTEPDWSLSPALRIMPQRFEDVGRQFRGPLVEKVEVE